MYLRKTIILSSTNGDNRKAVCNIEKQKNEYVGNIRLYNFKEEPDGILTLGFLSNDKVIKAGLTYKNNFFYSFKSSEEINLEKSSCALMNIIGGNANPILYGSTTSNKMSESESRLISSLNILDKVIDKDEIEKTLNKNQIYLENDEEINDIIDNEISNTCDGKCSNCRYREAFYAEQQENIDVKENIFIDEIKDQIDILFQKYPEEELLNKIFPDSKWAKIDYENDGSYYVVGVIYQDEKIKYVCYGVPGEFDENPPIELKGFSKWLPIDTDNPKGFGYWISYQDAETGDNIEMNIV